mmetsp:Transcript_62361/g.146522  ORF Transcript_62361/g.146522 Transcript_62361/m.146522 type:complete len:89 (-) Transcript_62361:191-457(-)
MAGRMAVFTAGLAGAVGLGYAANTFDFKTKKESLAAKFSYVGYEPTTDKAIVQYTNEANARMIPATEMLSMEANPQLIRARRSAGFTV